jgi:hypothetical protein
MSAHRRIMKSMWVSTAHRASATAFSVIARKIETRARIAVLFVDFDVDRESHGKR